MLSTFRRENLEEPLYFPGADEKRISASKDKPTSSVGYGSTQTTQDATGDLIVSSSSMEQPTTVGVRVSSPTSSGEEYIEFKGHEPKTSASRATPKQDPKKELKKYLEKREEIKQVLLDIKEENQFEIERYNQRKREIEPLNSMLETLRCVLCMKKTPSNFYFVFSALAFATLALHFLYVGLESFKHTNLFNEAHFTYGKFENQSCSDYLYTPTTLSSKPYFFSSCEFYANSLASGEWNWNPDVLALTQFCGKLLQPACNLWTNPFYDVGAILGLAFFSLSAILLSRELGLNRYRGFLPCCSRTSNQRFLNEVKEAIEVPLQRRFAELTPDERLDFFQLDHPALVNQLEVGGTAEMVTDLFERAYTLEHRLIPLVADERKRQLRVAKPKKNEINTRLNYFRHRAFFTEKLNPELTEKIFSFLHDPDSHESDYLRREGEREAKRLAS